MTSARRWAAARAEHERAVAEFLRVLRAVPADRWQPPLGPGRWSPAALTLHVARAYEFGCDAVTGGPGMRLRVPALSAWLANRLLLPLLLATGRFPRGARAPAEVMPDLARARTLTPDAAAAHLARVAEEAVDALAGAAGRAGVRITHAYFGTLPPRRALRLLSAHTRHHARGLAAAVRAPGAG
jgi:hypothetical protein